MPNPYAYMDSLGAGLVGGGAAFAQGQRDEQDRQQQLAMRDLQMKQAQQQADKEQAYGEAIKANLAGEDVDSSNYQAMAAQLAKSGDPRAMQVYGQAQKMETEVTDRQRQNFTYNLSSAAKFALSNQPQMAQQHFDDSGLGVTYKGRDKEGNHLVAMVHTDDGQEHTDILTDDQMAFLGADPEKFLTQYVADQKNKQAASAKQAELERKVAESQRKSEDLQKQLDARERIADKRNNVTIQIQGMKGEQAAKKQAAKGSDQPTNELTNEMLAEMGIQGLPMPSRMSKNAIAACDAMAKEWDRQGRPSIAEFRAGYKADSHTLVKQVHTSTMADQLEQTAKKNISGLQSIVKKYNITGFDNVPMNKLANMIKRAGGSEGLAEYEMYLAGLQQEFAALANPDVTRALHVNVEEKFGKLLTSDKPIKTIMATLRAAQDEGHNRRVAAEEEVGKIRQRIASRGKAQSKSEQTKPVSNIPKAGEVRNGYRFKGGNPGDKNSWEKI